MGKKQGTDSGTSALAQPPAQTPDQPQQPPAQPAHDGPKHISRPGEDTPQDGVAQPAAAAPPPLAPGMVDAPQKPAHPKWGAMRPYYVGLTQECPLDHLTIPTVPKEGAFCVQKRTQQLADNGNGVYVLSTGQPGGIIEMFDDEHKLFLEYVQNTNILWESKGEHKRIQLMPASGEGSYRSRREDISGNVEPLAKYVWCVPAREVSMADHMQGATVLPKTLGD